MNTSPESPHLWLDAASRAVRLVRINVPAEAPRATYSPAGYRRLLASVDQHGILVPLLVRELGRGEFALVDGFTRVREALSRESSTRALRRILEDAKHGRVCAVRRRRPRTVKLGERSCARLEPIRGGVRAELHLEGDDKPVDVCRRLAELPA